MDTLRGSTVPSGHDSNTGLVGGIAGGATAWTAIVVAAVWVIARRPLKRLKSKRAAGTDVFSRLFGHVAEIREAKEQVTTAQNEATKAKQEAAEALEAQQEAVARASKSLQAESKK